MVASDSIVLPEPDSPTRPSVSSAQERERDLVDRVDRAFTHPKLDAEPSDVDQVSTGALSRDAVGSGTFPSTLIDS